MFCIGAVVRMKRCAMMEDRIVFVADHPFLFHLVNVVEEFTLFSGKLKLPASISIKDEL